MRRARLTAVPLVMLLLAGLVLPGSHPAMAQSGPQVLCYRPVGSNSPADCDNLAEAGKLQSPPWDVTIVEGAELGRIQALSDYILIGLSRGSAASLDAEAQRLRAYVEAGGDLLLLDPEFGAQLDPSLAAPGRLIRTNFPSELTRAGRFTPGVGDLTPAGLPAAGLSIVPLASLGPAWIPQTRAGFGEDVAATLASATLGSGRVVLATTGLTSAAYAAVVARWAGDFTIFVGPNMSVSAIEVTQAIQDLNNSVQLVGGKRTFVRVHVSSPSARSGVTATLSGVRRLNVGGIPVVIPLSPTLTPINPGGTITVKPFPDRGQVNDSFLFELPASWRGQGTLELTARLDPGNTVFDPVTSNNRLTRSVTFLPAQTLRLRLYNVQYSFGGVNRLAAASHLTALESWLRRAYPISSLSVVRRTYVYPSPGLPNVDTLNSNLALVRLFDILLGGVSSRTYYYGMVDDSGDFMRGKAAGIPGRISSGPTGSSGFAWDTDGSYGDWYGGHEIAHSQGRSHAEFCGAGGGAAYPYAGGRISPVLTGAAAIYGFDSSNRAIYDPSWKDVMTYCNNQWVSDFTYEGIRANLASVGALGPAAAQLQQGAFALVTGRISMASGLGELETVNVLDGTASPTEAAGDWSIVLLAGDAVLNTHSFTPEVLTDAEESPDQPAQFGELVQWAAGTTRVQLRRGAVVVDERAVSASPPSVSITAPAGGSLGNGPITVSWSASDPDGDALSYTLLHSNDGGATWRTIAADLAATSLVVQGAALPGGPQSKFRVVASDGVLSAFADSASFSLPDKAPELTIEQPPQGATYYPGQPVSLAASAADLEDGALDEAAFSWSSSLDGPISTGAVTQTLGLSTGTHVITASATDSAGNVSTGTRTITIAAADVALASSLDAAPGVIGVETALRGAAQTVTVTTRAVGDGGELGWSALSDAPWVRVRAAGGQAGATASGSTPTSLEVIVDPGGLAPGSYAATVQLTSGGNVQSIPVVLTVAGTRVDLPLLRR